MDRFSDSRYLLARFLAMIPPEVPGAMIILALQHPGLFIALFAIVVMLLKLGVIAIAFVAGFITSAIAGDIVTWYLGKMFGLHIWPRLPHSLRRFLLKLKDRTLFIRAHQDQTATRDEESAFSRNSHRHPHW